MRERGVDGASCASVRHIAASAADFGFDRPPQRQNLHDRARFDRLRIVDTQRPDARPLHDEHAAALTRLDHAFVLQPRDGLADHRAAYAELLREHRFGRQFARRGEAALLDLLLQLLCDGVAQRARRNLLEHASRWGS